jgi:alpha/beta hydrolase family protein
MLALLPQLAPADVDHIVIERREPVDGGRAFGAAGAYERISGKIYFAFDPKNPANGRVVDLDHAPRDRRGLVEAWAEFVVLRPVNPALGNGFALVEVVNRGRTLAPDAFDRCSAGAACRSARDVGDGFLLRHGYTVIWVGWQWDVSPNPPAGLTLLALHAPSAGDSIVGLVRTDWTIEDSTRVRPLGHGEVGVPVSRAYPVTSPDDTTAVLTVRDGPLDARRIVPRTTWSFAREDSGRVVPDPTFLRLAAGFQVGKIYELIYPARDPVIVGLGFLVIRDVASYAKYDPRSEFRVRRVIGFGVSQSGRFLRHYLYEGFNTDEHGRAALDGVFADVAGAGRGSFNYRFAGPSRDATTFKTFFFPVDQFPFTSRVEQDPVTGAADGLLDNPRAAPRLPKVMQVNGGYEYWARGASLIHTDVAATTDLPPIPNERLYAIASASHLFAEVPPPVASSIPGSRSFRGDPLDQRFALRALLEALRGWISGREPPPSRYPRIADGTLVPIDQVGFPSFDAVRRPNAGLVPRRIDYGPRWEEGILDRAPPVLGEPYRVLVPQVDTLGNDRGGVPSVETLAPLATYIGWQLRPGFPSAPDQLAAYTGSFIPLFRTEAERKAAGDPRPSIERLYPNRSAYRRAVAAAVRTLIQARFLLQEDSTLVSVRADSVWEWIESRR